MIPANSYIIIIAAVGAVISLFAGDYYFRYLDNKRGPMSPVEIEDDRENLDLPENIQLSFPEGEDMNTDLDSDNLAA